MAQLSFNAIKLALFQFDSDGASVARSYISEVSTSNPAAGANEATTSASVVIRPVDPVLLIYEERLETLRQLVRWVGRTFRLSTK